MSTTTARKGLFAVYGSFRMLLILFLGFSSGLPLLLTGGTLQAWLTDSKADLATIGKFALVGLPYALKFLWAPFFDTVPAPFLTRRRGWGIVVQISLIVSLVLLAFADPTTRMAQFALASVLVAFFSASQDIVIDALRIEILSQEELGAGGSTNTIGYRIAMIISGAVALAMADHMPWKTVYLIMALIQCVGLFAFFFAPETEGSLKQYISFKERVLIPFTDFLSKTSAIEILLFIMVYKLPTLMATALTTNFLMTLHFTKTEIGVIGKIYGLLASITGAFLGGALMARIGIKRALWFFGIIQALAGLTFIVLSEGLYGFHLSESFANAVMPENWGLLKRTMVEPRHFAMLWVIVADNFMMGLGVASLVGFMQSVCNRQFSASQYALLTSLMAVPRVILVSQAGAIAEFLGWTPYFIFSMLLAIPGLWMLVKYDSWVKSFEVKTQSSVSKIDIALFAVLMGGLILMTTDPLWTFIGLKDVGKTATWIGAIAVLMVTAAGFLKPKPRAT